MVTHTRFQDVDINLPVCPVKNFRYWSHMSATTTDANYIKNHLHLHPKTTAKRKRRRNIQTKKTMAIVELFALHANAIM